MAGPLDKLTKLDARLRCVANGKPDVNAVRARQNGAVRVKQRAATVQPVALPLVDGGLKTQGRSVRGIKRGKKQTELSSDVEVNVFVLFNRLDAPTPSVVTRRNGKIGR